MLFNSLPFLYAFLPITYLVFWWLRRKSHRYVWLTVTSYFFYGYWNYKFCALMAFSTVVSYTVGRALLAWDDPWRRRFCVATAVSVDLCLLGFFKYTNFVLESVVQAAAILHVPLAWPTLDIVLPIGISFYTFHTISYVVDSYRRTITPTRDFFEFACYVSLFSQLVAGPIVRFRQVEADLVALDTADRKANLDVGWSFFTIGMIKKVLVADTIAAVIDPVLAQPGKLSSLAGWMCLLGYAYQLYFDFSGYSDMAVGLGRLFGIRIPQNFNSPYKALDPSDFWHRWHISLSTCMRDYIFISLGGSRGSTLRTYRNLMLTMAIGGLWHGASWTFVAWGVYHGILLLLHRAAGGAWEVLPASARRVGTFVLVVVGWVFFRSTSIGMVGTWFRALLGCAGTTGFTGAPVLATLLVIAGFVAHACPNTFELDHAWRPAQVVRLSFLFAVCLLVLYGAPAMPFLYFQF